MSKSPLTGLCFSLLFFLALGQKTVQGQLVWPGDVNNNGIVNGVDLLWLGIAYDTDGPERPNATTLWQGQSLGPLWAQSFPGGLNYAYADCDGDGEVGEDDLDDAILPNFRLTHGTPQPDGFANAPPGSNAPRLTLIPSTDNAMPGETITVEVMLGSAEQPVEQFYGIAFTGAYNTELVDNNGQAFAFDDDDAWLAPEPDDEPIEHLFFRDAPGGEYEVAFVRTNQVPVSGYGPIGTFSIIIEDIIVGLTTDTLMLRVDSIRLIDQNNAVYSVVPDTALIVISVPAATHSGGDASPAIRVYPNPMQHTNESWVVTPPMMQPFGISDVLGRSVPVVFSAQSDRRWRIHWPAEVQPGWYVLKCVSSKGTVIAHTIIFH